MDKLIGKGTFTKVYQTSKNTVRYETECPVKYCLAEWMGHDALYPLIEKNREGELVGTLYNKVSTPKQQLRPFHYKIYKALRELNQGVKTFEEHHKDFDLIPYKRVREALKNWLDGLGNYINCDSIGFEISPRNIATNKSGDLILLDVFYSLELLKTYRK